MAEWNNLDDGLVGEIEEEEIEPVKEEMIYFENLISSSSTIVKVYAKDISLKDISVVNDSVGAHIIIIHDEQAFEQIESFSEKVVQDEKGDNYCVIFINEAVVNEIQDLITVKLDYQNILKKEDIEHETSTLLAG